MSVPSVRAGATVRDALVAIDEGGIGLTIVLDSADRFLGLATDGDIRRALLSGANLASPIAGAMRTDAVTVREGTPLEAVRELSSKRIRHIPVLTVDGHVAEIISINVDVRIPVAAPNITERELRYVTDCIVSNWISSGGPYVRRFEELFAEYCGTAHGVATSNGTTALHLTLAGLNIGPGDEVIVPTLTFVATANVVRYCGATPVFVDSEERTWNLDPAAVERAITPRTKAIIPVHLYGHPADMDPILQAAKRSGIAVIEDAAEAHGADYKGRRVGSLGLAGCYSFYGNKIVTTGEGGMVVTDDAKLAARLRFLRDHAMDPKRRYWHTEVGFNYRLTNLQAAVGVAQVEEIHTILERKQWQADIYRAELSGTAEIVLPPHEPWAAPVNWMFSVLLPRDRRDAIMSELGRNGIDTRPFFACVHEMPMYGGRAGQFPVAEELSGRGINLPSGVNLTRHEIQLSAGALRNALDGVAAFPRPS